ncbi:MAG: S41 family peptidase [Spirochaetes bacterium]|nr:S41 family peptidase [Spirochaetota bacterium]
MKENDVRKRTKERIIWISVTAVLLSIIVILSFAPKALAANKEADAQRYLGLFYDVFQFVRDNYVDESKVQPKKLIDGALKGMFESLGDPYSMYLTADEMRQLTDTTTGRFGGVGLIITKVDNGVLVVAPIEDSPAYKEGISAGDIIVKINNESSVDLKINEVVNKLRGKPGTKVEVTILRGEHLTFNVEITRGIIEVPTVKRAMIPGGIGYLRITQFTPITPVRVKEAIEYFKQNNYRSMIIDLRSNPGGLLDAVYRVADYFLSNGTIVSTRGRIASEDKIYKASARNTIVDKKVPIIVLVDKGSASASEILAGALKDTKRAVLMGEKTFGKGSVQQVRRIDNSGFKLTMAKYYTPSGISIDKIGIIPDKVIKEKELSKEEQKELSELLNGNYIKNFVKEHPKTAEPDVISFMKKLEKDKIKLDERYIKKLIRNERNRTNNNPPVYDLDYDIVLKAAVGELRK